VGKPELTIKVSERPGTASVGQLAAWARLWKWLAQGQGQAGERPTEQKEAPRGEQ